MKHFYPLAWAVVDRETLRTWKWFIELLRNSLDLADGEGVTFMSDMHKVVVYDLNKFFISVNSYTNNTLTCYDFNCYKGN